MNFFFLSFVFSGPLKSQSRYVLIFVFILFFVESRPNISRGRSMCTTKGYETMREYQKPTAKIEEKKFSRISSR